MKKIIKILALGVITLSGNLVGMKKNEKTPLVRKSDSEVVFEGHDYKISSVSLHPKEKIAVSQSGHLLGFWDLKGKKLSSLLLNEGLPLPFLVKFLPGKKDLFIVGMLGSYRRHFLIMKLNHDSIDLERRFETVLDEDPRCKDVCVKRGLVTLGSFYGKIRVFNFDGKLLKEFQIPDNYPQNLEVQNSNNQLGVDCIKIHPNKKLVVTADGPNRCYCGDRRLIVWDLDGVNLKNCGVEDVFRVSHKDFGVGHKCRVNCIEFHPEEDFFVSGDDRGNMKFWNLLNGLCFRVIRDNDRPISIIKFNFSGNTIFSSSKDSVLKVWESNGNFLKDLDGHTDEISCIEMHPNKNIVITGSLDKTLRLWNIPFSKISKFGKDMMKKKEFFDLVVFFE